MNINNVTQFISFIQSNNLESLDGAFLKLSNCLKNYSAACNCHKTEDKQRMYETCNRMYSDAVKYIVPKYKNIVLRKVSEGRISFYKDPGGLIMTISH